MESVTRWIFIALAGVLAWIYVPKLLGGGKDAAQPIGVGRTESAEYKFVGEPQKCEVKGKHFKAQLSSRGAALVDYFITDDERYTEGGKPIEVTTVPGSAPERFDLHFDWRASRPPTNRRSLTTCSIGRSSPRRTVPAPSRTLTITSS